MYNALIIDDDPIQLRIAEMLLKKCGSFNSTSYQNAGHALDHLKTHLQNESILPDVIFIDLHMPELNGWDFLNTYENLLPDISKSINVFIVTSSIDLHDQKRSSDYPFLKGFITKPITPEGLNEIANHVNISQLNKTSCSSVSH